MPETSAEKKNRVGLVTRGPEFHTKSPPWPENHTKTADPENHTTHAENGLEITLDSLENALILNKNTERTVGVVLD